MRLDLLMIPFESVSILLNLMRFFFRESPSVADENFPFFIFFDAEFFSHPHGDIRKYKFCKKYSQMAPETLRLPY